MPPPSAPARVPPKPSPSSPSGASPPSAGGRRWRSASSSSQPSGPRRWGPRAHRDRRRGPARGAGRAARAARPPAQVHTSQQCRGARGDRAVAARGRWISAVVLSSPLTSPDTRAQIRAGTERGRGGRVRNSEPGRSGAVRPLWSEADSLRERVADAPALFGFFSFDAALAQHASHGHLRTNPAARAALIRLCAAPNTRGAVISGRRVETLQRRLRLHRLGYVGVHGAEVQNFGLRLVTEPVLEEAEQAIGRLRKACARVPALQAPGIAVEDRVWALVLHLHHGAAAEQVAAAEQFRSEERRVGKECRSRWSPYH